VTLPKSNLHIPLQRLAIHSRDLHNHHTLPSHPHPPNGQQIPDPVTSQPALQHRLAQTSMPSKKVLSVIGGLSIDSIFNISQLPERGACVRSRKHKELGGRGTNIAIAAYRSLHNRPRTADGLLPIDDDDNIEDETTDDEDEIEVRIVGAIDNDDERKQQFTRLFRQNGVKTRGIQVFNDDVEKSAHTALSQRAYSEDLSIIDGTGRARQLFTPGVADKWEPEHFDRIEKLGGGVRPDLVVTTMELKREVVEKIIDTAHAAGVEIIVYGSPATQIVRGCFEKITHYICNEGDAAILLGYDKGDVYWDKWGQVTEDLMRMGVKNVVLTLGPAGVYYRNEQEHGYISGYRRLKQIEDSSGLT